MTYSPDENRGAPGKLIPAARGVPAYREPYGPVDAYARGAPDEAPGSEFNPLEYWRILNKRKWLILGVVAAFVTLGAVRTLMTPPLYTATVRLQIDRNVAKIVEGGNITPVEGMDSEFLRTQYELLQSRTMAERVASALKLGDDAGFLKPKEFSIIGAVTGIMMSNPKKENASPDKASLERAAANIVLSNRAARPIPGSRMVDITYSDSVPSTAQKIANAYANAFTSASLDKRFQANSYAKTFLEDQLKQLKLRLEESEKVLLEFAQKEQIVAVTEKASIAENNLASANTALGSLISERIKNEQLWKQVAAASAINLPQLLTNSVIDGLRGKRSALVTEYQEKLETFKPDYPAMLQINNKIAEIDRQLGAEVKIIKASFKAAYESSKSQEAQMTKQIDALKTEVLDLQGRSIQYNILKREVDSNRSLYDGLLQRYKEVDIAGGTGSNNVFIVDSAELPDSPSSPNMSRALLLSFALGLGAALAGSYVLERLDDSVGSPDELERISSLATLGIIPKIDAVKSVEAELADPRSALSEAYRSLCTALQFSTETGLPKSLFVTSSGPSEGKSITSVAVSRHFAAMNLKVLLVDGDLRNPSLHVKLGLDNSIGLSNYLTGGCTPPEAMQRTSLPNLAFMASGPLPPNAADLLSSSRLLSLLSIGAEIFNLIVIDGPPIMGLADAPLLSNASAATIFVVGAGQARIGQVRGSLRRLQMARSPVIGVVLTKFDAKNAGYGYGYGYGYGDHAYGHAISAANGQDARLTSA